MKTARNLLGLEMNDNSVSPKKPKKLVVEYSDSTSVSDDETVDTSDDNIDVSDDSSTHSNVEVTEILPEIIKVEDFVLIKFERKKSVIYYVAHILSLDGSNFTISYLRRKGSTSTFVFPNTEDEISHIAEISDIVPVLPKRRVTHGTSIKNC
ncbi:hypothetical protein JTB14_010150 [Gonioctena quinquepunctata]|nr:hypothetical protein JTB14_010150 [Gonioctena quinquepunctata]